MAMIQGWSDFAGEIVVAGRDPLPAHGAGRRIALIGRAEQLVPLVAPLADDAGKLTVFQRHPCWVVPERDALLPARNPRRAVSVARRHLNAWIPERWMRRQLTPSRTGADGSVPVLASDRYYPALLQAHCKLLTWPVDRLSRHGVRSVEGIEHHCDLIVVAAPEQRSIAA